MAATAVGLSRHTVMYWERNDVFQFNDRLKIAHADYCETIEQRIDDRLDNPQGNRGSDPLLMFKAKAEMPEKYREDIKVIEACQFAQSIVNKRQTQPGFAEALAVASVQRAMQNSWDSQSWQQVTSLRQD